MNRRKSCRCKRVKDTRQHVKKPGHQSWGRISVVGLLFSTTSHHVSSLAPKEKKRKRSWGKKEDARWGGGRRWEEGAGRNSKLKLSYRSGSYIVKICAMNDRTRWSWDSSQGQGQAGVQGRRLGRSLRAGHTALLKKEKTFSWRIASAFAIIFNTLSWSWLTSWMYKAAGNATGMPLLTIRW